MKRMLTSFLLVATISLPGCLRDMGTGSNFRVSQLATHSINSVAVSGRTLTFSLVRAIPKAGCWKYLRTDQSAEDGKYLVTVQGQRTTNDPCLQVMGSVQVSTSITVPNPGTYEFSFWQYDTTIDTTITIQ